MVEVKRRIKQKEDIKVPIKKLDKKTLYKQKLKNNIIKARTRESTEEKEDSNPNVYSINKITKKEKDIYHRGMADFKKYGAKSIKKTRQNANYVVQRIKQKKAEEVRKTIKQRGKTIKIQDGTGKIAYKTAKQTEKAAVKAGKKAYKIAKEGAKVTEKNIKLGVKATIIAAKTIIVSSKAILSLLLAGGCVAVIVIVLLCIIGGAFALFFGGNDGEVNANSIITVATAEVGNIGGEKFWRWYRF